MNSRSELRASHCVRTPLAIHLSCRAFICYDCLVFTVFVPLYLSVDPEAAVDYPAAGYDYVVDDRTPTVELPGKQSHSLPQISPTFSILSCTRNCYCCCYDCYPIQLHSLFLSPLMYLLYPMLPINNYAFFSSEPCALLARIR